MGRKRKPRWVDFNPGIRFFKPQGVALSSLEEVVLTLDQVEAVRLADLEGMEQTKASKRMKVSQSTFQRILTETHRKVAEALILGKAIRMEGGEVVMPFSRARGGGRGRGMGAGGGRGRMGGPLAAGPGGTCLCTNPECKNEVSHVAGQPCYQMKCPKCGSPMVRR